LSLTGEIHYKFGGVAVKNFAEELTADYADKTDLPRLFRIRVIRGSLFFGAERAKMSADGR
jgi:hypothetical protein